jgi:4-nitrophenyl phosphatase
VSSSRLRNAHKGLRDTHRTLCNVHGLLMDMDGVIYREQQALPGAHAFFDFLRTYDIPFVLVTNNSSRTTQQIRDHLANMGLSLTPEEILTSAQATALYLRERAPAGARVLPVGHEGLRAALRDAGFSLVDTRPADYVVAGIDWHFTYDTLKQAGLAIRDGAGFVGTNPDRTFPGKEGILPGAGAILAALTAYTDVEPVIIGKPALPLIELALARLDVPASQVAIVGDRLETDILAGQRAGLLTILVLTGVTQRQALAASDIAPNLVFEDLAELQRAWQSNT